MKKRITCLMLCLALAAGLAAPAVAADAPDTASLTIDGTVLAEHPAMVYDGTSYVSFYRVTLTLRPDVAVEWEEDRLVARGADLVMSAKVGQSYLEVNGRYLYIPDGVRADESGDTLVPSRTLAQALGASISWDGGVALTSGTAPLAGGEGFYNAEDLDLLARVISHESGNQPLEGKIAVGNVILNRTTTQGFADTISGVIYQKGQFPGATDATPNAESVLAAKLCLEGAMVVPGALYFNGANKPCWASANKTLIAVIGGHAFYG